MRWVNPSMATESPSRTCAATASGRVIIRAIESFLHGPGPCFRDHPRPASNASGARPECPKVMHAHPMKARASSASVTRMDLARAKTESESAARGYAGRVTPMMEQYIEIKAANPDCLLFYRMGDFYELFFDDAEVASRALGIVLTKRGKHLGRDIPMCGVPIERADEYLHRLIALGHRVAVCEQMEDPAEARKRGNKSVVRRDVVRLVTPGTLTEDTLLDAKRNNYLLALARARASSGDDRFALAWIDISTGEFRVAECERAAIAAAIAR